MIFLFIIILPLLNSIILCFFGNKIGTFGAKLCVFGFIGLALIIVLNFFFLISQRNFFLEIGLSKLRTKRDFLIFYKQVSRKLPFRVQKSESLNLFNSL